MITSACQYSICQRLTKRKYSAKKSNYGGPVWITAEESERQMSVTVRQGSHGNGTSGEWHGREAPESTPAEPVNAPVVFMGLLGMDSHNREEAELVRHLAARGHLVLYLTPLGVRDVGPRDLLTGLRRLRRSGRLAPGVAGVHSASLLVLPWRALRPVAWLNRLLVRWQLAWALRSLAVERPIFWLRLPTPELVDQTDALGARGVVYDCIDNYAAYPQYDEVERERLAHYERRLVARADLLVTLTASVAARFPEAAERTHVVPLGVDLDLFGRPPGLVPADLERLPRPRLGLVGGLDGRVDFDLLHRLAVAEPTWSLVLIGPLAGGIDPGPMARLPNVHFLGPRDYEMVPDYLTGLDVCLIPYRRTAWTVGVFPAKLHEYLATGQPVVAVDLPGLAPYAGAIELASDADGFIAACRRAVDERDPAPAARRRAIAASHSLEARCCILDDLIRSLET